LRHGPPIALAAHQGFSALVTESNRARCGEVVHLYEGNLGAVTAQPPAGTPAAGGTLSMLSAPIGGVRSGTSDAVAEIVFAGLAPGLYGVWRHHRDRMADPDLRIGRVSTPAFDIAGYLPFEAAN
jgi:uncharacterized protein (TIGR03437 family)